MDAECAYRGTQPRHSPALSVRAAAGEMMFAASRRDLHGTITSVGSEATGLAPPSRSSRAWEASRCASLGTASPMSFATNLHHQAVEHVPRSGSVRESGATKTLEQAPADRSPSAYFLCRRIREVFLPPRWLGLVRADLTDVRLDPKSGARADSPELPLWAQQRKSWLQQPK